MNSALFAAFEMLSPVHGFLRRFGARETFVTARVFSVRARSAAQASAAGFSPAPPSARPAEVAVLPFVSESSPHARSRTAYHARNRANLPLRVVRVMDNDRESARGERMMISGRMADVCAELDRMAQREASQGVGI